MEHQPIWADFPSEMLDRDCARIAPTTIVHQSDLLIEVKPVRIRDIPRASHDVLTAAQLGLGAGATS